MEGGESANVTELTIRERADPCVPDLVSARVCLFEWMRCEEGAGRMTTPAELDIYRSFNLPLLFWTMDEDGNDPKEWKGPHAKGWNDNHRVYDLRQFDPAISSIRPLPGGSFWRRHRPRWRSPDRASC